MAQQTESVCDDYRARTTLVISRRTAVGASALAALGLLSRSVFGQTESKAAPSKGADPNALASRRGSQRSEEIRALLDRMGDAGSLEERKKIIAEMGESNRKRTIEAFKQQLGVSDSEWPVMKPRVEAVYNLVHPTQQASGNAAQPGNDIEQKGRELREILSDEKAATDQIKAKLTAYRAARQKAEQDLAKARQSLCQVVTLRQEALLVLNGLLT